MQAYIVVPQFDPQSLRALGICCLGLGGMVNAKTSVQRKIERPLDAFLRRCRILGGYCDSDISTVAELFDEADETLLHHILANNNHVLQSYLPDRSRS